MTQGTPTATGDANTKFDDSPRPKRGTNPDCPLTQGANNMCYRKRFFATAVSALALLALTGSLAAKSGKIPPAPPDSGDLRIIVLEGEDGVNVLKKKTAVRPVVEVRDKNNLPIAGVAVLFFLPRGGARAEFANGAKQFSAVTDANGQAMASTMRPIGKGAFQIQVRATYQGQTASTSISQTNFSTVAQALKAGKTPGSSAHASAESAGNAASESSSGASASGASAGTSGAASSSGAAAGASSAAAGAGAAGGMSAGAIAGVVGGVAAAGAGAGIAVTKHNSDSQQKDCNSILDQTISDLNAAESVCSASSSTYDQCRSSAQRVLDDLGRVCACSSTVIPPEYRSEFVDLLRGTGLTLPSACGF